jgi:hypothetical protein
MKERRQLYFITLGSVVHRRSSNVFFSKLSLLKALPYLFARIQTASDSDVMLVWNSLA